MKETGMRILYFDCFSGISGDMTIGALLDLGIDRGLFLHELSKLGLEGYRIEITDKTVNGIKGTDVNVVLEDSAAEHEHGYERQHEHEHGYGSTTDHNHDHNHHNHEQNHSHDHGHNYDHEHVHVHSHGERGLAEIEQILDNSSLSDKVKAFSKKVFREIAAAEAKVHNKPIDEVHFHEVGAIDSIVDIAGTAICLELLGVEKVYCSELHDGKGFIECRHGLIPVPVPAVMEMLAGSGIPLVPEDVETELVTPTGMGLIKTLASGFGARPAMTVLKTGYGFGKRYTGKFNALRVILGETLEKHPESSDEVAVLETNIDDTTPEILGYTISRLMEAGALDAFFTPVFMKKNRPAYMLSVIATPEKEEQLVEIILKETTTLGIRRSCMKRYCMSREIVSVNTQYGTANVKIAAMGTIRKASPEYEDCRKIAEKAGIPLSKAFAIVSAEALKQYDL